MNSFVRFFANFYLALITYIQFEHANDVAEAACCRGQLGLCLLD